MRNLFIALLIACILAFSAIAAEVITPPEGFKAEPISLPEKCTRTANEGDIVTIHFTASIDPSSPTGVANRELDSTFNRRPFAFRLGDDNILKGINEGIKGMCVGERRLVVVPAEWGYGEKGANGVVPANAVLRYEILLVGATDQAPPQPNLFSIIDLNKDGLLSRDEILSWFLYGQNMPVRYALARVRAIFEEEDKNKDGFICWEEFSGPKGDTPIVPTTPSTENNESTSEETESETESETAPEETEDAPPAEATVAAAELSEEDAIAENEEATGEETEHAESADNTEATDATEETASE